MFACEHEGVTPDIICLSKGITGGYLPLAATIATEEIYSAFLGEYREFKTFFHGHSYTGNPLGCATALACLDVFDSEQTLQAMAPKVALFRSWMETVSAHPHVGDARSRGLMGGVDLVADKATGREYPMEEKMGWRVAHAARGRGVIFRPLGNTVVLMPPLAISLDNLTRMLEVIAESIDEAVAP
jgi:adenosylmethionine-8-amino-7-oxononanoate aminotransferase